jgi:hypothetical protein
MGSGLRSIETTPGYQAGDGQDSINTSQGVSIPHINGGFKLSAAHCTATWAKRAYYPEWRPPTRLGTVNPREAQPVKKHYSLAIPMRVNPRLSGAPANPIMTQKGSATD